MKVVAFAGGVGGAKLVQGLASILTPEELTIIVNTGDDFNHLGMRICPDIDTVCYTLAGLVNPETGWGRAGETWNSLSALKVLGEPDWFRVGDLDLATHLARTDLLKQGKLLSEITRGFCTAWNIRHKIIPMTDDRVSTQIMDSTGTWLDFQDYFVRQAWQPVVKQIRFDGSEKARPASGIIRSCEDANLIVICPSNPLVSIDPILSIPGILETINDKPKVAVSPIIGNSAVKGPLAKMIFELYGITPTAAWVADYYLRSLNLTGLIVDEHDTEQVTLINGKGIICKEAQTLMTGIAERVHLAKEVISFGKSISVGTN